MRGQEAHQWGHWYWAKIQQQGRISKLSFWQKSAVSLSYKILGFGRWFSPNTLSAMTTSGLLALWGSWLCSLCWTWQIWSVYVLRMQKGFWSCSCNCSCSSSVEHCRDGDLNWSRRVFPMFLVLPLLPSVSTKVVATSRSEECEGKMRCDRESHKQDLNSRTSG